MIRDEVSKQIAAAPDAVWSLVANATRMAEWSPTVERVEWVGDASGPEIGARFRGHNRQAGVRWSRECVITTCEPGRELTFEGRSTHIPRCLVRSISIRPLGSRMSSASASQVLSGSATSVNSAPCAAPDPSAPPP